MLLVVHILAFCGAITLFAAGLAWWKVVRFPAHDESAGDIDLDSRRVLTAARVTAIAFALCAIAAILALAEWFFRQPSAG